MVRDFTDSAKEELISLVHETEDEKWCDITDWIGDRYYDFQEWIGVLKLEDDLSNVTDYHKKMIDKNNATLADIEKIFANVYNVESTYNVKLNSIITTLNAYNKLVGSLTDIINPKNKGFTADKIATFMRSSQYAQFWQLMNANISAYNDYEQFLHDLKLKGNITDEDMDAFIALYEAHYPGQTEKVNELLSKLSEDDLRRVKYYIYSAEEPYRSIYLNELESYTIGDLTVSGVFYSNRNTVNLEIKGEANNPKGPYTTFFHETGHAVDYNYNDDGDFYSRTFRDSNGQSLYDAMYADVRNDVSNTLDEYVTDSAMKEHLLEYIMSGGTGVKLSSTERKLLENIQNYYKNDLAGTADGANGISDVFGGMTKNLLLGDWGHRKEGYWFDQNGNPTNKQSTEMWAHYYSYSMTGNQAALDNLRARFPNSYQVLEEMAQSMTE